MLPSIGMEPQDELQQLLAQASGPQAENSRRRKKRSRRPNAASATTLTRQIRRAQARLSSADRKRRTRRLILIGSYIEHTTQADQASMTRLMKGLDAFLERDQDRALFDLAPKVAHPQGGAP